MVCSAVFARAVDPTVICCVGVLDCHVDTHVVGHLNCYAVSAVRATVDNSLVVVASAMTAGALNAVPVDSSATASASAATAASISYY